ncbi:MAG TPA: 16S rRNA (guanine(966)-N(2))-methyltransferase RsmD [Clostridium sp.]|uniref:16S rRNA (Guanine(966)-N(2))-methyltransferase RsmD n=1 Tax=Acetivibrio mesophilus TaxID=2487273 RepID=A0A4Q0I7V6_9FIRM|nr:16S rRNA (guanine(966)-N(2))-methyltransferase RsmD [Clostridium sp. Bc-iso-3]RXE60057.1 16S rRNA (guanine(966)-N(2))-methyltransferase RsmD [Acetivibrio mesophilus]HHV28721.1 16S rRNA (guanine(966)-N(2))-methyltransferase RsmD [Clostridium sp.]
MEEFVILRVIAGTAKGHKLKTIKGLTTRPTSDKVKGSVFNILAVLIPEAKVLDIYAGTGSLGIEALSRGADSAVFVDKSSECSLTIRENLAHTKLESKATVIAGDVFVILNKISKNNKKFDIIFLDPPYGKGLVGETLKSIVENDIIVPEGIIVAEHDVADMVPEEVGSLKRYRWQKYGDTVISFYRSNPV